MIMIIKKLYFIGIVALDVVVVIVIVVVVIVVVVVIIIKFNSNNIG